MREISINKNDIGYCKTIQLHYEDLECFELPEGCNYCPVGFRACKDGCGRHELASKEEVLAANTCRPATCKLTVVDSDSDKNRLELFEELLDGYIGALRAAHRSECPSTFFKSWSCPAEDCSCSSCTDKAFKALRETLLSNYINC